MNIRIIIAVVFAAIYMTGCATSKRGAKDIFMVQTTPPGAKVETTILLDRKITLAQQDYDAIQSGETPEPKLSFLSCEPTPCGFEIPRKLEFDIYVAKEGYAPQAHKIDYYHRKKIAKKIKNEVARNTLVGTAAAGALGATGVAAGTTLASLGTATASTGAIVGGAAILAAPVIGIGLISVGVDGATGANYDYWPNPAALNLEPQESSINAKPEAMSYQTFDKMRRSQIIRPAPTAAEVRLEKQARETARKDRLENNSFLKEYIKTGASGTVVKLKDERRERQIKADIEAAFEE